MHTLLSHSLTLWWEIRHCRCVVALYYTRKQICTDLQFEPNWSLAALMHTLRTYLLTGGTGKQISTDLQFESNLSLAMLMHTLITYLLAYLLTGGKYTIYSKTTDNTSKIIFKPKISCPILIPRSLAAGDVCLCHLCPTDNIHFSSYSASALICFLNLNLVLISILPTPVKRGRRQCSAHRYIYIYIYIYISAGHAASHADPDQTNRPESICLSTSLFFWIWGRLLANPKTHQLVRL